MLLALIFFIKAVYLVLNLVQPPGGHFMAPFLCHPLLIKNH